MPGRSPFVGGKAAWRELADPCGRRRRPAGAAIARLEVIRAEFGRPYESEACIEPEPLAAMISRVPEAAPPESCACEPAVLPCADGRSPGKQKTRPSRWTAGSRE
ncbi:hypothetical protein [Nonomuraea dietziae]|uniref:hypothetical protein n=1 Tax=Nonomuraea dietziae TaxID=65515 RepID=UPI003428B1B1